MYNFIMNNLILCAFGTIIFYIDNCYGVNYGEPQVEGYCKPGSLVLNDCNWCTCTVRQTYRCQPKQCAGVDSFGHFNDAIEAIKVGMEGHGSWRTSETPCLPGLKYTSKDMLCVCSDDGNWPNPVCRDVFRYLHSVIIGDKSYVTKNDKCTPGRLYLVSCNICFCNNDGYHDPDLCTSMYCSDDWPKKIETDNNVKRDNEIFNEVYAECDVNMNYRIGCQQCTCIRNNRLLCNNCTTDERKRERDDGTQVMCGDREVHEIFIVDCNLCFCNEDGLVYCSVKNCLPNRNENYVEREGSLMTSGKTLVLVPSDPEDCVPGVRYKDDCNHCYCYLSDGVKIYSCTMKLCIKKDKIDLITSDCVVGSTYEKNCQICTCEYKNDVKFERCESNPACKDDKDSKRDEDDRKELSSLHGYCEPLHFYQKDCNKCRCTANGNIISCTDRVCVEHEKLTPERNDVVEVVPVISRYKETCPAGRTYKFRCNLCFCLLDGNAICTNMKC